MIKIEYIFLSIIAIGISLLYFRLADHFNIIDKPNERSSHSQITIRGGGIVFLVAGLCFALYTGFERPFFWIGFLLIATVSFIDDIKTLSSFVRLPIHFIAVMLLLFQSFQLDGAIWYWVIGLILATGIINAYNFMDGINGITAGYSLVVLLSMLAINQKFPFTEDDLIISFIIADLVFGFFNFRKKAKCFAGDVGSVTIAFAIVYLLLELILQTKNFFFIMLLAIYGVDSVLTIVYRLRKKENIFEAHRSHLYQWLVKPGPFTHVQMSIIYMLLQALISVGIVTLMYAEARYQWYFSLIVLVTLGLFYMGLKHRFKLRYGLV